jgi:hypothetical protein
LRPLRKREADECECNEQSEDFHDLSLFLVDDCLRVNPSQFLPAGRMSGGGFSLLADLTRRDGAALDWGESTTFLVPHGNDKMI